jgi:hypothetical protein
MELYERQPLQFRNFVVCQRCGRFKKRGEAIDDGWLIAPYIKNPAIDVVRCYRHITIGILSRSFAGRTGYWIRLMKTGRERAANEKVLIHPYLEPFPHGDKDWEI